MESGIITIDLHGKNVYQAKITLDASLRRAGNGVYRLRIIHGHQNGTALRETVYNEYATHFKVKRIEKINESVTDLILREL